MSFNGIKFSASWTPCSANEIHSKNFLSFESIISSTAFNVSPILSPGYYWSPSNIPSNNLFSCLINPANKPAEFRPPPGAISNER